MSSSYNNRFGFFVTKPQPAAKKTPSNDAMVKLECFIEAGYQKLLLEAPNLSRQEHLWELLLNTLKRCVNNYSTEGSFAWHPRYLKDYYPVKALILWQRYEAKYQPVVLDQFAENLAQAVAEERRETVKKEHVEAQQNLMNQKMSYTPTTLTNQKNKLETKKEADLEEINKLVPQFIDYANDIIEFCKQPENAEVQNALNEAIREIERQELAIYSNPGIFDLALSTRHKGHALATLDGNDNMKTMQIFCNVFKEKSEAIATSLKGQNALS